MPLLVTSGLLAVGCFDTVQAQNLTLSTTSLSFSTAKGSNPPTQTVTTGSSGGSFNFTISSNQSWLSAATSVFTGATGTTGQTLTVQVTSSSLASGTYNGTVTLTPDNSSSPANIAVTLTVAGSGNTAYILSSSLSNLYFAYQLNQTGGPAPEMVQITSSGISLPISVSTSITASPNCPPNWLQVTSSAASTPATLTAAVNTAGLAAGTCGASITVTSNTPSNGTTSTVIQVIAYISANPVLNVNIPAGLTQVTLTQGAAPQVFNIQLTSSDPNVALNFSATSSSAPWLAPPTPSSGSTPASLYVQITPGLTLTPGTYNASITINSPTIFSGPSSGGQLTIPISFTLLPNSAVGISPSGAQNFTEVQGGSLPSPITLTLTGGANPSSFTTSVTPGPVGGSWLQISPSTGNLGPNGSVPITLSVAANTLGQAVYSSTATITFVPSTIPSITIFVSLTVGAPASALVATPSTISFSYQTGGAVPSAQGVSISDAATGSIPYALGGISDSWIVVSNATGNTPGTISVGVTPQNLQPGMYNGSFTLTSTVTGVPSLTIPVSLFVSASSTPQPFLIGNNSSGVGGQLSPGEIIYIKGSGLGPSPGQTGISTTLGGVQVAFNGILGTLLYVSPTQIDAIVPYEVAGQTDVDIVVTYGSPAAPIPATVVAASLGISTISQTGSGQAAALNLSGPNPYNTASTPALEGTYISVYGTGGGQTNPLSTDGEISPTATLLPLVLSQYVTATIGGKAATVQFAGAAPGEITGVVQFNILVPTGVSGPALPLLITINGVQSQAGVTVAVQ